MLGHHVGNSFRLQLELVGEVIHCPRRALPGLFAVRVGRLQRPQQHAEQLHLLWTVKPVVLLLQRMRQCASMEERVQEPCRGKIAFGRRRPGGLHQVHGVREQLPSSCEGRVLGAPDPRGVEVAHHQTAPLVVQLVAADHVVDQSISLGRKDGPVAEEPALQQS